MTCPNPLIEVYEICYSRDDGSSSAIATVWDRARADAYCARPNSDCHVIAVNVPESVAFEICEREG